MVFINAPPERKSRSFHDAEEGQCGSPGKTLQDPERLLSEAMEEEGLEKVKRVVSMPSCVRFVSTESVSCCFSLGNRSTPSTVAKAGDREETSIAWGGVRFCSGGYFWAVVEEVVYHLRAVSPPTPTPSAHAPENKLCARTTTPTAIFENLRLPILSILFPHFYACRRLEK